MVKQQDPAVAIRPNRPIEDLAERRHTLAYIRLILSRRPIFFVFPSKMEANFLEKRVESSLFYIHSGQWLLLMLFSIIIGLAWMYFRDVMVADHFLLLKYIYFPTGVSILFVLYGSRLSWVRQHFHKTMFVVGLAQLILIQRKRPVVSSSTSSIYP